MSDTAKNSNILDACSVDGRLDVLQGLFEQLETCQKSLSEYLDTKRCSFPRFYFISDVRAPEFRHISSVCVCLCAENRDESSSTEKVESAIDRTY